MIIVNIATFICSLLIVIKYGVSNEIASGWFVVSLLSLGNIAKNIIELKQTNDF